MELPNLTKTDISYNITKEVKPIIEMSHEEFIAEKLRKKRECEKRRREKIKKDEKKLRHLKKQKHERYLKIIEDEKKHNALKKKKRESYLRRKQEGRLETKMSKKKKVDNHIPFTVSEQVDSPATIEQIIPPDLLY